MAFRIEAPCRAHIGPENRPCPNHRLPGSFYCTDHNHLTVSDAKAKNRRDNEKTNSVYGYGWKKFTQLLRMNGNYACQHIDIYTNRRCIRPIAIFHHLLDAQAFPQFVRDYRNVCGVCREHHPESVGGEPINSGNRYVPTLWSNPGEPFAKETTAPGELLKPGDPFWSLDSQKKVLGVK